MNLIEVKVNFAEGICTKNERMLITGDYNSTKLIFEFDRQDGIKIFEMKDPSGKLALVKEITDDSIILAGINEEGKFYSVFQTEGEYVFEISLYENDSKLTSAYNCLQVQKEQVVIGDEVVEAYLPIFDELINKIKKSSEYAKEQGDYAKGIYEEVKQKLDDGELKGDKGDKGDPGEITQEDIQRIADAAGSIILESIDDKLQTIENKIPDVSDFITKDVDNLTNYTDNEELRKKLDKKADYESVSHDIDNLTELTKELQDVTTKGIYVGYISSVTPTRDVIERILESAIKLGASTLILRPTADLPQDFTAISSGQNLQKYKNGGRGSIAFNDINEHTTINAMPSVVSYVTTVSFEVTVQNDDIDVSITDVTTKFVSGINSTSQQAYVLHTKNEEAYTPTKDYNPSTKKYVDDNVNKLKENFDKQIGDIDAMLDLINGEVIDTLMPNESNRIIELGKENNIDNLMLNEDIKIGGEQWQ